MPGMRADAGSAEMLSDAALQKARAMDQAAAVLGEIVSLLIRSPGHARYTLADLDWLLVPAIINRQFLVLRAQRPGGVAAVSAAAVLWAELSPELDAALRQDASQRHGLTAAHRKSGEIVWITDTIGDPLVWNPALRRLRETTFKGRRLVVMRTAADGETTIIDHPAET